MYGNDYGNNMVGGNYGNNGGQNFQGNMGQANYAVGGSYQQNQPQYYAQLAPMPQGQPYLATGQFSDPNSFVPQNMREMNRNNSNVQYFSTLGVDIYGNPTKFYFTQEERDYLTKTGMTAQEFYNQYQSKLGGNFVAGMPKNQQGMHGPEYFKPESFIPQDMRRACVDKGYTKFVFKDELGLDREAYLSQEEVAFIQMQNLDISTYMNVYAGEFNYDKGQMEASMQSAGQERASEAEMVMERTTNNE